jgi:uncharacterized membrane protein YbhN (UPF0104 family)
LSPTDAADRSLPPPARASSPRKRLLLALKLALTAAAFWLLLSRVELSELAQAARRISAPPLLGAGALQIGNLLLGAVRWRLLLQAYGARPPALASLTRVYFVGAFYNTYLPGAVSGDLVRGVASRRAFAHDGATRSMAVVLIDRAVGLCGLLALSVVTTALFAVGRFGAQVIAVGALALLSLLGGILLVSRGPELARSLPAWLARSVGRLPRLARPAPFLWALGLALINHVNVALCGHLLVRAAAPGLRLVDSLLAMPLSGAAGFFPFTVAGAGARDLAMVALYTALGYPRSAALAGSFALLLVSLCSTGLGGLLQLLAPLALPASGSDRAPSAEARGSAREQNTD